MPWEKGLDIALKILLAAACLCVVFALTFCSPISFRPTFSPVVKPPPAVVTVVTGAATGGRLGASGPPTVLINWPPLPLAFLVAVTLVVLVLLLVQRERLSAPAGVLGSGPESNVSRMAALSIVIAAALPQLGEALGELKYLVSIVGGALALAPLILRLFREWWLRAGAAAVIIMIIFGLNVALLYHNYRVLNPKTHEWIKPQMQSGWIWFQEHVANLQPDALISFWVILAFLSVNIVVAVMTKKATVS